MSEVTFTGTLRWSGENESLMREWGMRNCIRQMQITLWKNFAINRRDGAITGEGNHINIKSILSLFLLMGGVAACFMQMK